MNKPHFVHLATAPDQITAEIWVDMLRNVGIAAFVHPMDSVSYLGVSAIGTRVQVLESDLERAREVIDSVDEA